MRPAWRSALAALAPIAGGVLAVVIAFDWDWSQYPVNLLLFFATMTGAAWLTGLTGQRRLAQGAELEALAAAARRRAAAEAVQAVAAERLRVARELHDLVGHGLTSITLQCAAAGHLLATRRGEAATALDAIARVGAELDGELRQLLAALDGRRELPAPRLAELPRLVARARADGLDARLALEGDPAAVPPGPGGAAWRIVQEALVNARKHGGDGPVTVRVRCAADRLAVAVASPLGRAGAAPPPAAPGPAAAAWSGGQGIAGMRERARLYGGRLAAGPSGDGARWVVRAELPLAPAAPAAALSPGSRSPGG